MNQKQGKNFNNIYFLPIIFINYEKVRAKFEIQNKSIQISCDGGAATGKSTGAKLITKKCKLNFFSSGLLYRYKLLIIKYKPKSELTLIKNYFAKLNINAWKN